jgi:hypothetical protein
MLDLELSADVDEGCVIYVGDGNTDDDPFQSVMEYERWRRTRKPKEGVVSVTLFTRVSGLSRRGIYDISEFGATVQYNGDQLIIDIDEPTDPRQLRHAYNIALGVSGDLPAMRHGIADAVNSGWMPPTTDPASQQDTIAGEAVTA